MARKFQIGDTVEVVKDVGKKTREDLDLSFKVGHKGVVIEYDGKDDYPYEIMRKNGNTQYFKVQELKLIKRGTK